MIDRLRKGTLGLKIIMIDKTSGIAKPRPTRACVLPSTSQALPSLFQQESHDSIVKYTRSKSMTCLAMLASMSTCIT